MKLGAVVFGLALLAGTAFAGPQEHSMMTQPKMPAAFERLKQLVGTWSGEKDMMGKPYTVTYELTAGGTAVLEREFAGTPHEMITVYDVEGNRVAATHYCMLGNQPHMTLVKSSPNMLSFVMEGHSGIHASGEPHMHSLDLTFTDKNHVTATWTEFEHGKKNHVTVMELTRKS